ncbi:MAG: HIT family protein [Candidatus Woesearchaeota archaeon]
MNNCRFCNIDPKRSKVIKKFKYCYVMFSNPRLVPGHLLVIPNRHVKRISDLKDDELLELMHVTNTYCDKVLKFSEGYMIKNNYMPFLKESERKVNHMHIHIIPRYNLDELYTKAMIHENELFKYLTDKECKEIIKKISK